jgi:FdhD protein
VGDALLAERLPLRNNVLMVSGRGGFEIVQKALVAGIPILAAVSAPSSLAVQLSRDYGLTLVGFLRDRRFIVYSGESRLKPFGS